MPEHVTPTNDLHEHVTSGDPCPCMPRITDNGLVVIHNSYDKREVGEVMRRALNHLPTYYKMKEDYQHAMHLLNVHWPKEP